MWHSDTKLFQSSHYVQMFFFYYTITLLLNDIACSFTDVACICSEFVHLKGVFDLKQIFDVRIDFKLHDF